MLYNISNHPLSTWSQEQYNAAKQRWGEVVDVPFPQIDPFATTEQIIEQTQRECERYIEIIEQAQPKSAFHIMGEHTFCYHAVRILKERGYCVVASTAHRNSTQVGQDKLSTFIFASFREY